MNTLLALLKRHQAFLVFLLLEVCALVMHFSYDYRVKAGVGLLSRSAEASVEKLVYSFRAYLDLNERSDRLAAENLELRNRLAAMEYARGEREWEADSAGEGHFRFIAGEVVNNSVARAHNFFTVDQGREAGVREGMGVLSYGGVAGVVVASTGHYAAVISVLNRDLRISAKLQRSGYVGTLKWDGESYQRVLLTEIPHHVPVTPGDTVVTSGFSNIFPKGLLIGLVEGVEVRGADFLTLRVRLKADFKRLHLVSIVANTHREELDSIATQMVSEDER
ncbi:MAG: hypothetical protein CSA07_05275 [Bacteroidia bacterium]|nr:MAG: hypothetical protein CSA07_05275 [Bacteroidia bacterium]